MNERTQLGDSLDGRRVGRKYRCFCDDGLRDGADEWGLMTEKGQSMEQMLRYHSPLH